MGIEPISEGWEGLAGTSSPKNERPQGKQPSADGSLHQTQSSVQADVMMLQRQITLLIGTIVGTNERAFGGRFSELSDAESVIFRCVPNQAL